ncbi:MULTISPECIES: hypothetical protein [unclassified Streptomyces]|uniref:Uncharacterized protein n=1 Tax=Streptomyces sp. NBC_00119 TaxID=2975659 RepID=A0AAU1TXC2_9ACTN|nr:MULTISPECIES: hypothetical protein [unclassified Streptomyces]MCX4648372.1 hypothetical protein [Streptomyces sp. NBC_01446]MCX5323511.1 hypothetical protein [Streptomyces sp. NBC_00120]
MGLAGASMFLVEGARGELLGPLLALALLADALLVVLELAFQMGIRSPGDVLVMAQLFCGPAGFLMKDISRA